MTPYETFEQHGLTVELHQDLDAEAPDNEESDLFIVTTRNRHFELHPRGLTAADIPGDRDLKRHYEIFPLFAYIHSGIAFSLGRVGQFADPWDSGQIGFVLVEKAAFRGHGKRLAAAGTYVDTWNQFLSGDVWGVVVEEAGEHLDSCWGFYGLEYARAQGKEMAEAAAETRGAVDQMERASYAL